MARFKRIEFVERDDPDDVEPGALVWSATVQTGSYFAGGVVAEIVRADAKTGEVFDDPIVRVIRWDKGQPYLWDMPLSDVNPEATTFFTAACDKEAQNLHRWLGKLKLRDRRGAVQWVQLAAGLAAMAATGSVTPNAEARYQAGRAEQRVLQDRASALLWDDPVVDVSARAAELAPKLEAAIEAARARRQS